LWIEVGVGGNRRAGRHAELRVEPR
jgi:hypothetical protein